MSRTRTALTMMAALTALALVSAPTFAQNGGPTEGRRGDRAERGDRGDRGEGRGRGDFRGRGDGEGRGDFRQRMADRMKEQLGVSDEEWQVLQPRIDKVRTLQMQSRGGTGMFVGRRGGPGAGADAAENNAPQSEVAAAAQDLRTALQDEKANADTIKAKLEALRQARARAREQLAAAQKELRELLSVKQEAQLVMLGILE